MIIEVSQERFRKAFSSDPHPFLSEKFLDLNKHKVERLVRLLPDNDKPSIGLIAGVKDGVLLSPFSAPFGGFHFRTEIIYASEIDNFLMSLQTYITKAQLKGTTIILPPNIYHPTFNAKIVNSILRVGFKADIPDITNWVDLHIFNRSFIQKNTREYLRQAIRNKLSFSITDRITEKQMIYDLIRENRMKFSRPIFMTFEDVLATANIWPVDFIKVCINGDEMVASAIFYRNHPYICYAAYWGDNDIGRPLRAMDFLTFSLWNHYKDLGYTYIDLGISTEAGKPNEGLLRFKESHDSQSSLRYKFRWTINPQDL